MKGRVKGLLGGAAQEQGLVEQHEPVEYAPEPQDPDAQRRALQVLTLAQRTADEHVASAQQQADRIRAEARAAADGVRRDAEKVIVDARAQGAEITKAAQAKAADLEREAQHRYDEVVGSLEGKRAALQQQIEALQQFDRDYRGRLRNFMQGQLQALGEEMPRSTVEIPAPAAAPNGR